jgi:hypothetical protein
MRSRGHVKGVELAPTLAGTLAHNAGECRNNMLQPGSDSLMNPVPVGLDPGQGSDRQQRSKLQQRLVERRSAGETCPELLAAFGREPSNPATVWSNGATDGGSHDPHRIELPVVARHPRNRSQERHRRTRCLKNPVPKAARTGLQDFWIGGSEPMMPIKEKIELR